MIAEKILQIGEGNFLRAFVEPLVQEANDHGFDGSVVIVPPRKWDNCAELMAQDCRYTLITRGKQNGEVINERQDMTCVSRCLNPKTDAQALFDLMRSPALEIIVSNTTEAGIFYCKGSTLDTSLSDGYSAMLTRLLWERFSAGEKGLWILPCELIEDNAGTLLRCVRQYAVDYNLSSGFFAWLDTCSFCNTLVDRIVTGHPAEESDPMATACEPFFFWAVECKKPYLSTFPLYSEKFPITLSEDIRPYRMRKVRLLNGMHTAASAAAFLSGISIVRDMVNDEIFRAFLQKYSDRVIALTPMDKGELTAFRDAVLERFDNPFIDHSLHGICMNTVSKFNARCKDVMLYNDPETVKMLSFTLAAILCYIEGNGHTVEDDEAVLRFAKMDFSNLSDRVQTFAGFFPGIETIPGLLQGIEALYIQIQTAGIKATLKTVME